MRWIPDTIASRTLLVLLVGLTVSHALSAAMYLNDRPPVLNQVGGESIGERIAGIGRIIDNLPEAERLGAVARAAGPTLRITLSPENRVTENVGDDPLIQSLRHALTANLQEPDTHKLHIGYLDATKTRAADGQEIDPAARAAKTVLVSLELRDGGWLNFYIPVEPRYEFWSLRFGLSMVVMIIAVVIFSAIVVHYLIGPLRLFVRAANRFGVDVDAPPLPEAGPREVREATHAFNNMQQRIHRMITNRTHMLAAISHDLRTPVTLLRLRAEFIENDEEREKTMATLSEMESMIAATLAFAREDAETEDSRLVDLTALIGSICDDLEDAGQSVAFDPGPKVTYVCRPTALRRALANLIGNAVAYGDTAHVRLSDAPETVQIAIEDEGPGIPPDQIENVFEPFYRVEQSRSHSTGGVGLGLSVARTVIQAHGGDVLLSNRPEGGLRATVRLPR